MHRHAGFSFQPDQIAKVDVDVKKYLADFQQVVDKFAENEQFARHVLTASKANDHDALEALDRDRISLWSSDFWQTKKWYWALYRVVPPLVLELAKYEPTSKPLLKAYTFFTKTWKWSPKSMNRWEETATKYLSVLKDLRTYLTAAQAAAASVGKAEVQSLSVGKFDIYDGMGAGAKVLDKAQGVLRDATTAMSRIGLGEFCYGKVTVVESAKFHAGSAAFYVANTDEIYLSPDIGGQDVRATCHEIAHRVYFKLNLRHQSEELYESVKERGLWVTGYAKTNASENFCEMVSFAAIGKLTEDARPLLESVTRQIRVASRFLGWA